jgi:hypothetical protein
LEDNGARRKQKARESLFQMAVEDSETAKSSKRDDQISQVECARSDNIGHRALAIDYVGNHKQQKRS